MAVVTNDWSIIVLFVKFLRDVHNHYIMNSCIHLVHTVKLVFSYHSKKDKTKILKTNGSLRSQVLQDALLDLH